MPLLMSTPDLRGSTRRRARRSPAEGAHRALTTALRCKPALDLDDYGQQLAGRLDGFEILEPLGRGGMGVVFRARETRLGRDVAIKVLLPPSDADQLIAWRKRFEREAVTMARLQHPNILTIFDFGQDDDLAWIVLEFVDGTTLRELLAEGALSQDEAFDIAAQLGSALQFAHERGVVHRDIKPENVLISERGHVKVADFGIAKVDDPNLESLTVTDQVLGTRPYVAPELLRPGAVVDSRTDVYAFGAVVYEMLTGSLTVGNFAPPSSTPGVDQDLDEPILRALDPDPDGRTESISETLRAIRQLRESRAAGRPPLHISALRMAAQELAIRQSWLVVATCSMGISSLGLVWIDSLSEDIRGWDAGMGPLTAAAFALPVLVRTVVGSHHARRLQGLFDLACSAGAIALATYPWWRYDLYHVVAPGAWVAMTCGLVLALQALAAIVMGPTAGQRTRQETAAERRQVGSSRTW